MVRSSEVHFDEFPVSCNFIMRGAQALLTGKLVLMEGKTAPFVVPSFALARYSVARWSDLSLKVGKARYRVHRHEVCDRLRMLQVFLRHAALLFNG